MKYLVLVPDGAADYPIESLGGQTPLEAAQTPHLDQLAREGQGGLVQIIPPSRPAGSDIGNLEIFGYDSRVHYTGRAPLEAASMGLPVGPEDIVYRCNTITREGDILVDYSAGHISTPEAKELIEIIEAALGREGLRFYPGVGYRHIVVWNQGPEGLKSFPPHDIMGQSIAVHLPAGPRQEEVRELMRQAGALLEPAVVNKRRREQGKGQGNAIWLWGEGRPLQLPGMEEKYGLKGGVISAVDLVRGIGRSAGMEVIEVPGITGYLDTNYQGKAQYALEALKKLDLVYVHVEAPDEAGHNGDAMAKKQAIEDFDRQVVGTLLDGLAQLGPCRILVSPDHRTPIRLRTHSREPVPFLLWGSGVRTDGLMAYNEKAAEGGSLHLGHGHQMMDLLTGEKAG
ncbi:MAG: cofactor-independent phosphoglycerate mutase [Candidatus Latescibacteria bacterium]|nr:cofactor-independent phosphoglycerate mutase [Candidatus Latescibacterota bacterium]